MDILVLRAWVALEELQFSVEVHGTDKTHQLNVAGGVGSRDVSRAAIHVITILHAVYRLVQFGAAIARSHSKGQAPHSADRVENEVDEVFEVARLLRIGMLGIPSDTAVSLWVSSEREKYFIFVLCFVFRVMGYGLACSV